MCLILCSSNYVLCCCAEFDPCAESINGLADLVEKEKKRLAGCVNGIDCSYMSFASHALDRRSSVSGTLSQSAPPGFSISGQHSHPYHNAGRTFVLQPFACSFFRFT